MVPDHEGDGSRGRDTSEELAEVRTVLSRAEDARCTLWRWQTGQLGRRGGRWEFGTGGPAVYVGGGYEPDPDVAEMIEALDAAIVSLNRWRRTGRKLKGS